MGLLSKLTQGVTPAKKAEDDALLLFGMITMAAADGEIVSKEAESLRTYFVTLPEFEDKDYEDVYQRAAAIMARYETPLEGVAALAELSSTALKLKMFVIAADIAMSSGDVDQAEDEMLSTMQTVLEIDEPTATNIINVLALKYTRG